VQANGTLTEIKDPDNAKTTFGYDGSLRLLTLTDRAGKTTTLGYDSQSGKLASVQAPQVYVSGVGNRNPTAWLEPWQKRGVPYSSTSGTPFSAPVIDSVDARVRAPDSVAIRYRVFDAFGKPSFAHSPLGLVDTTYYNGNGQVTDLRTPTGMRSTFTYDGTGFMTQSVVDGTTINRTNGGWGQASYVWGDVTSQNIYLNSGNGRVDSIRLAGNNAVKYRYTYDSHGRVATATDPENHLVARRWYAGTNGNRSKDSLPGGRVTTYGYDTYGRDTSVSVTGMPTRRVAYDVLNRPSAMYDGVNGSPTQLGYDSLYLRSVTDAKGQVYQYLRDALGRVTGQIDPVGRRDTTEFGWLGEVRRYVNRRGQAITLAYDSLMRRTIRQGTGLSADTLSYSANGRTVIGASETSIESIYLSKRRQPDSVTTVFRSDGSKVFWRRYEYDPRARVTSVTGTGSSVFFQSKVYDWAGDATLTDLTLGTTVTEFGYNNDLRRELTTLPGTNHTITQNVSTVHSAIDRASVALDELYHYDVTHRMDRAWHGGYSQNQELYTYDGLGRLTDVSYESSASVCYNVEWDNGWTCIQGSPYDSAHFAYDQVGNRTDLSGSYSAGNRISAFDGCSYGTDFDGNVTSRSCSGDTVTFSWNALNQLTSYARNDSTVNLRYDAFGRLVRQWGTPVDEQFFLWDRTHLHATLWGHLQSAVAQYSYYPGTDRLHAIVVGTTQYYGHQDGLGNVRGLTTADKTVQRTYSYDEWGQVLGGSDNANLNGRDRARFKGALWMGDGGVELYYMRNRWYEPRTGRFLSEDPIGLAGGINVYAFAAADPVNGLDPFGLDPDPECPDGQYWSPTLEECVPLATPGQPPIEVIGEKSGDLLVEEDACDVYPAGLVGWFAGAVCRNASGPEWPDVNNCVASCLANDYAQQVQQNGGQQLNDLQMAEYLLVDHFIHCYPGCGGYSLRQLYHDLSYGPPGTIGPWQYGQPGFFGWWFGRF
jgi:RHS repeat-associated protein